MRKVSLLRQSDKRGATGRVLLKMILGGMLVSLVRPLESSLISKSL